MSLTNEDLQQIDKIVTGAVSGLATKPELKEAVSGLATIAELKAAVSGLATKAELKEAVSGLATRSELDRFATKSDLDRMEGRLTAGIGLLQRDTYDRLDQHEVRITRLEKSLIK